jgi:regulator of sirC expression with transglutaminase-like and TPR domain
MRAFRIALLALCMSLTAAVAQSPETTIAAFEAEVEALFEPSRSLLNIKLSVDVMVDPSVDGAVVENMVGRMAADIAAMAGENGNSASKLAALKRYLYESGSWNDYKPFQYDLDDPLGEKPSNRLLWRYMTTRRGNCITMPLLILALGERLGLTMTLAEAPLHVFVKYTDDKGKIWNLEATSGGGFTRDAWYRQKLPMSDNAVMNGVYLRALSHEETAVLVASLLIDYHMARGDFERAIASSEVLLRHYPNFAYGLVKQGSAYGGMLRRELSGKYTRIEDIPAGLKARVDQWYRRNKEAFARAEALGWRPEDGQVHN